MFLFSNGKGPGRNDTGPLRLSFAVSEPDAGVACDFSLRTVSSLGVVRPNQRTARDADTFLDVALIAGRGAFDQLVLHVPGCCFGAGHLDRRGDLDLREAVDDRLGNPPLDGLLGQTRDGVICECTHGLILPASLGALGRVLPFVLFLHAELAAGVGDGRVFVLTPGTSSFFESEVDVDIAGHVSSSENGIGNVHHVFSRDVGETLS